MKTSILLLFTSFVPLFGDTLEWTDEGRRIESEQVRLWDNKLAEVAHSAPDLKFSQLWLGLRIMGHRVSFDGHSSEVDKIYRKLQFEFLSIPGHAEYFGRRIREANEPLKGPEYGKFVHEARNERMYGFQTLSNLPSPETVKVVGEMLSDTWRKEFNPPPGSEDVVRPPNSLALDAIDGCLRNLPLRDPPSVPRLMAGYDPEVVWVLPWQNWYSEIKSGKRAFSFKGQNVEYRFRPDGTWEAQAMASPPDDGPKPDSSMSGALRPEKSPPPSPPALNAQSPRGSEPTDSLQISASVIACGVLILAVLAFFLKRRHP